MKIDKIISSLLFNETRPERFSSLNEEAVKIIFDYVRNISLSSLVFLAGKGLYLNPLGSFEKFVGSVIGLAGFSLLILNIFYVNQRLHKLKMPRFFYFIVALFILSLTSGVFVFLLRSSKL